MLTKQGELKSAYHYWNGYLKRSDWTRWRDEATEQFAVVKAETGVLPDLAEAKPTWPGRSSGSALENRLAVISQMIEDGKKEQAYRELVAMIESTEDVESLPKEDGKAMRKAAILRENLSVELGRSADLLEL